VSGRRAARAAGPRSVESREGGGDDEGAPGAELQRSSRHGEREEEGRRESEGEGDE